MKNQFKLLQETLQYVNESDESWVHEYTSKETTDKMKGASKKDIEAVEKEIGFKLPKDHIDYLMKRDGGFCNHRHFIIFSVGEGVHPDETLLKSNETKLHKHIRIGREATEDFAYQEQDLKKNISVGSAPVYVHIHEENAFEKVAESFEEFVKFIYTKNFEDTEEAQNVQGIWKIIKSKSKTIKLEHKELNSLDKMNMVQESLQFVNEILWTGLYVPGIDDVGDYVADQADKAVGRMVVRGTKSYLKDYIEKNKMQTVVVASVLGGGLLTLAIRSIYKRFFTEAGRSCAGAQDKGECLKAYKIKAIKTAMAELESSKGKLRELPDPYRSKAIANLDNQIKIQKDRINSLI